MNEMLIGTGIGLALSVVGGAIALGYQWVSSNMKSKQKSTVKEALKEYEAETTITADGKTKIK